GRNPKVPMGAEGGPDLPLPAFGKTGTTNDYRNETFLGYISAPKGMNKGFDSQSGYAIGDYVGFDDNVSMVRKGFKGTGSSLAIPAWLAQARAVAEVREFGNMLDLLDLDIQATGQAPVFQQDKYARYL